MQGINISSVMAEAFKDNVPSGVVLLFDSTMPTNLGEVPFNPYIDDVSVLDALPEFVSITRVVPKEAILSAGQTTVPFNFPANPYGAAFGTTSFPVPLVHAWSTDQASLVTSGWSWNDHILYSSFRKDHTVDYLDCGTGPGAFITIDLPELETSLGSATQLTGFGFIQRDITYTRTYEGSTGTGSTRATSVSFDYWDPTLNEGAGDWVTHQTFTGLGTSPGILNFTTPLDTTGITQARLTCLEGAEAIAGSTNVSGDPHWSVGSIQLFSDEQAYVASTTANMRTPIWGMFIPFTDFGSRTNIVAGEFSYNAQNLNPPYLVFDVGSVGSNAGVELIDINTTKYGDSRINKFNLNFQGFGS